MAFIASTTHIVGGDDDLFDVYELSDPFDSPEAAWGALASIRREYEEQQVGYEQQAEYTGAVKFLDALSQARSVDALDLFDTEEQILSWTMGKHYDKVLIANDFTAPSVDDCTMFAVKEAE